MFNGKRLGICVSSDRHLDKVIGLCKAARAKGVEVEIFFTHLGTRLTQEPAFKKLEGLARMSLCNVAFDANKLRKPVSGISERDFATQERHCDMIEACDRYVSL